MRIRCAERDERARIEQARLGVGDHGLGEGCGAAGPVADAITIAPAVELVIVPDRARVRRADLNLLGEEVG